MYHGLIDGDILAYRAGYIADKAGCDPIPLIDEMLWNWITSAMCESYTICFGDRSYRQELYPEYKQHRNPDQKPNSLPKILEYLHNHDHTLQHTNVETDDILGILQTKPNAEASCLPTVIITVDKDLLQIPGMHFNPVKHTHPVNISPFEGSLNLWAQVMMGDRADNYAGLWKVGPVKAYKTLLDVVQTSGWGNIPSTVEALYEAAAASERKINSIDINFKLAKILTYEDITDEAKNLVGKSGSKLEPDDWEEIYTRSVDATQFKVR